MWNSSSKIQAWDVVQLAEYMKPWLQSPAWYNTGNSDSYLTQEVDTGWSKVQGYSQLQSELRG